MELNGKTIVVTRAREQAKNFVRLIEERGGKALIFPTVAFKAATENFGNALSNALHFDWIVFSSANAVRFFDLQWLKNSSLKVAAVGKKTAHLLQKNNIQVDLVPDDFSAKGLLYVFKTMEIKDQKFLLPVSNLSRDELKNGLTELGAIVQTVVVYQTVANKEFPSEKFLNLLRQNAIDVITFFSPSAFRFLLDLTGREALNLIQERSVAVAAIGRTTAEAIKSAGVPVTIEAKESTGEGLVQAIVDYFNKEGK